MLSISGFVDDATFAHNGTGHNYLRFPMMARSLCFPMSTTVLANSDQLEKGEVKSVVDAVCAAQN